MRRLTIALSDEKHRALKKAAVRQGKSSRQIIEETDDILADIPADGMFREASESKIRAPDREDQHLWDLLDVYPGASLVRGEKLLIENVPENTPILTPRQFADIHGL